MIDRGPLLLQRRELSTAQLRPFRIGVAADKEAPAWVHDLVAFLGDIPAFDVSAFSTGANPPAEHIPTLTQRLYAASKQRFDPFTTKDFPSIDIANLPGAGMDILVWLAAHDTLPDPCSSFARFGVLTVQLGEERNAPPYWSEARDERLTASAVIHWHAASRNRARVIRAAETSTPGGLFFTRTAEEPLHAVSRMIAGIALDIAVEGEPWKQRMSAIPEVERRALNPTYPSNSESLAFLTRQAARSVRLRLQARGRRFTWFTAIRRQPSLFYANTGRFLHDAWEDVPMPAGSEMADPFVFERDRKTWLFYEDVPAGASKGRLSCMEIEAGGFGQPQVILNKDHHLSYPCVFEDRDEVFMLPETSAAGTVQLYRAKRFPFEFEPAAILVEDSALVDTTPFLHDGIWYFFTTTAQPFMETFLFWSDTLDGRWRMHPRSPISSSVFSSRSAGHLFYLAGRLLRPTQDCSVRYGYGMTVNEVTRLTPAEFEEHRVDSIGPDWRPGLLGTHTLNSSSSFEVVDGIRYES